jgi:hypothetical protein
LSQSWFNLQSSCGIEASYYLNITIYLNITWLNNLSYNILIRHPTSGGNSDWICATSSSNEYAFNKLGKQHRTSSISANTCNNQIGHWKRNIKIRT